MSKMLQIRYCQENDRLTWGDWDIHCGDILYVMLPDQSGGAEWRTASFEHSDLKGGWYMPALPGVSPIGLWARENKD